MIIPQKNAKSYGVVHMQEDFSFIGFTKSLLDKETSKIDIFVNEVFYETISSNKHIQKVCEVYDIDEENICFNYKIPKEQIKGENIISLKNHFTKEELTNSPIQLSNTNEYSKNFFLYDVDDNKSNSQKAYTLDFDTISFLATEKNIKDVEFLNFLYRIKDHYQVKIKALYYENSLLNELENLKIKTINVKIKNTDELSSNLGIVYIHYLDEEFSSILSYLSKNISDTSLFVFTEEILDKTIKDMEIINKKVHSVFLNNIADFDFDKKFLTSEGSKYYLPLEEHILSQIEGEVLFSENSLYYDYLIQHKLKYLLESTKYREYFNKVNSTISEKFIP